MTLDDLRVFNAVCEAQSLSAVARDLGCTQPAVSQHVTRIERELGVAVLDRSAKGVALTHAGQILYHASSAGLGALSLAVREIHRLRAGEAGRLSISTGGTTVRHFMRDAVVRFRELIPRRTLGFEPGVAPRRVASKWSPADAPTSHSSRFNRELPGFELRPVLEQPLMLLVRADDPLASRRHVRIQDLRTISYIALSESTAHNGLIREHVGQQGVSLTPTARVDDFDTANVFVECRIARRDDEVHAQQVAAGGERPHVQVVYLPHPVDRQQASFYVCQAHLARRALHQDVHRLADDVPRAVQDEETDADAHQRIGDIPPPQQHHHTGDQCTDGAECVTEHVHECGAHVETPGVRVAQHLQARDVHQQADRGDDDHAAALHHRWSVQR